MIVVSNTSPIINLAAIGQLELLHNLYDRVKISQAVYYEIVIRGAGKPGSQEVRDLEWIETQEVSNTPLLSSLQTQLHKGEAEAIVQAIEIQADLLLLDERNARRVASQMGLIFIGVLGILVKAKRQGLINLLRPLLDDLRTSAGFWVTENLYAEVLASVDE